MVSRAYRASGCYFAPQRVQVEISGVHYNFERNYKKLATKRPLIEQRQNRAAHHMSRSFITSSGKADAHADAEVCAGDSSYQGEDVRQP